MAPNSLSAVSSLSPSNVHPSSFSKPTLTTRLPMKTTIVKLDEIERWLANLELHAIDTIEPSLLTRPMHTYTHPIPSVCELDEKSEDEDPRPPKKKRKIQAYNGPFKVLSLLSKPPAYLVSKATSLTSYKELRAPLRLSLVTELFLDKSMPHELATLFHILEFRYE